MNGMFYPNWKEKVLISTECPQPQTLIENSKMKVIVVGLESGQKIPVHPEASAVYHILEGRGWMTVDDERHEIEAGATIITLDGASRGVEAKTDLIFLAVRIP
jgi:quercetin dioxygenase-like cupin family protein